VIRVRSPGGLTTVQDLGRPGYAELGVGVSGAADRVALRAANRLIGNPAGRAALEVTLGGLDVEFTVAATVALTGAPTPANIDFGVAVTVAAGARVTLGLPTAGLRTYLAVRGGVAAEPVLGSCSTDTLSGLGPPALRAGDELAIGPQPRTPISGATALAPSWPAELRVVLGPRADWFTDAALEQLMTMEWTVRPDSNRIGIRLDGPGLARLRTGELPSEATRPGALQVPPDGRPILLGPDAPVTGGYPVIAVVHSAQLHRAGQLRPGQPIRFRRAGSAG
jgi:biotin-dependent carboxylase-like uncharacterized protein